MRQVLRRIAIHGGLTAVVLGIVGLMFADLAGLFMAGATPARSKATVGAPDTTVLRTRVPFTMAFWGFAIVVAGELVLYRVRKRRTPPPAPAIPVDSTESLIQQLLAEADANAARPAASADPGINTPPPANLPAITEVPHHALPADSTN